MGPPLALLDIGDCPLPTEKFSPTHPSPMESVGSASVDGLSDGIFRGDPSPFPKHALKNQTKSSSHIALQPTSYQSVGSGSVSRGSPQEPLRSPSSFSKKTTHASSFSTLIASHSGAGSLDSSSPVVATDSFSCSSGSPKEAAGTPNKPANLGTIEPSRSKSGSVPVTQKLLGAAECLEDIQEVRGSCSSTEMLLDMESAVECTSTSSASAAKNVAQKQLSSGDQPHQDSKVIQPSSISCSSASSLQHLSHQKQKHSSGPNSTT